MHPNPAFRQESDTRNITFVRERAFGVLAVNGSRGPLTSSIPALISENGKSLEFHLVRSNPIVEVLEEPQDVVFIVSGPDSYVSPDWYGAKEQVPTWNYVAVRIEGVASKRNDDELLPMLDRLSAQFEKQLQPKPPWTTSKMSKDVLSKMMRSIVPFSIDITMIHGTWKLNQNKPDRARKNAALEIELSGIGMSVEEVAKLMREDE